MQNSPVTDVDINEALKNCVQRAKQDPTSLPVASTTHHHLYGQGCKTDSHT